MLAPAEETPPDPNRIFFISKINKEKRDSKGNRLFLVTWKPTLSDKPLINQYKGHIIRESRVHGGKYKTIWCQEWIPAENFSDPTIVQEWDKQKAEKANKKAHYSLRRQKS